jgi:SAM-dependent methyltransferase
MNQIRLYTIAYSEATLRTAGEGYLILDNSGNPRPDWREYWPIRRFLLDQALDPEAFYGFFSPRFAEKTGLCHRDVCRFVESASPTVDVVTFSPQPDIGAFFPNVFVGGEMADPGFLAAGQMLVDRAGLGIDVAALVADSTRTVFSNFVVARPSYWREWLRICEVVFEACETGPFDSKFSQALLKRTSYGEGVARKVFIVEGVASLILSQRDASTILAYSPFGFAWSTQLGKFKEEAVICDALKFAIRTTGFAEYRSAFDSIQKKVLNKSFEQQRTTKVPTMKQTPAHDLYNDTILALMPATLRKVLEVGCMRGSLCYAYRKQNAGCHWVGVDIDPENVEIARAVCDETLCRDIENVRPEEFMQWADVEAWIFGDTLEHLRDPWSLISHIRKVIPSNGMIIASIPNAQHWSFQARVNVGQFRYEDDGLFDRTHLRFFTRITIFEMFQAAGFRVDSAVARIIESPRAAAYIPHIRGMAEASGHDPDEAEKDALAFQYVVRAFPV